MEHFDDDWALASRLVHADKSVRMPNTDVVPPITMSTTFDVTDSSEYVYGRIAQPVRSKVEAVLSSLEGGFAVTYSSGLAAAYAALVFFKPKRVAINGGYHGTKQVIQLFTTTSTHTTIIDLTAEPQSGDVFWLETPKNPCCDVADVEDFCERVHAAGGKVIVDATFAPAPLQYCLKLGADLIMHSTTKYLGGHSDCTGGALIAATEAQSAQLLHERLVLGSVPGSMESWLLLRSLRTFTLRLKQQCETAARLASYLVTAPHVTRVWHPSVANHPDHELAKRTLKGCPMMSIELDATWRAKALASKLRLFTYATSLGGVECLIDWRYKWDQSLPPTLLRVSVGLEDADDIINDFQQALASLETEEHQ